MQVVRRVLALDPGAERCGWCVLLHEEGTDPRPLGSGIVAVPRGKTEFQPYRSHLISEWVNEITELLKWTKPTEIVYETIPAASSTNFVVATQSYLAHAQITTVHAIALANGYHNISQLGATTVKARIGGKKSATKVQVRNGVLEIMPGIAHKRTEWIAAKTFDESDAFAIALTHLGYRRPKESL